MVRVAILALEGMDAASARALQATANRGLSLGKTCDIAPPPGYFQPTMPKPKVLFVEDESSISGPFSKALAREGFEPVVAATAERALQLAEEIDPDIVLLDLTLPDGDGRDVCRAIRRRSNVPILMLTARGTETDRIVGLEIGADDYVVKPFSGAEVIARIRAVLRRTGDSAGEEQPEPEPVTVGELHVDPGARRARLAGEELQLSPQGVRPAVGARHPRRARRHPRGPDGARVGRELVRLHEDARRPHPLAAPEARRRPRAPRYLHTVRGVGFRFTAPEEWE